MICVYSKLGHKCILYTKVPREWPKYTKIRGPVHRSFSSTWTTGARQLVVQEALDTTLWFALSYSVWFTPQTSQFWITQWHSRAAGFQMSEHESPLQPYGHQTPSNSSMNSLSYKCSFPSGISSHVWWHQRLYPKQNPMIIPSLSH